MGRIRKRKQPIETEVSQITSMRLLAYLRSLHIVNHKEFDADLGRLFKGLLFETGWEWFDERKPCRFAGYVASGLAYSYYLHPVKGRVILEFFKVGQIFTDADSLFTGSLSDFGVEVIAGSKLVYVTGDDMQGLFHGHSQSKDLTIKAISRMVKMRFKDELLHHSIDDRIEKFFECYPILLRPARKAPVPYQDIATYLHIPESSFSRRMKLIYTDLK